MEHRTINQTLLKIMAVVLLPLLATMHSCYYDDEETLYTAGSNPCDTTNVTYSGTVVPILNANCLGCHSGADPSGNISLDSYGAVRAYGQISAGQPGSLYGAITHNPTNFFMPKTGGQLPDCDIKKIKAWIDAGMPEN